MNKFKELSDEEIMNISGSGSYSGPYYEFVNNREYPYVPEDYNL